MPPERNDMPSFNKCIFMGNLTRDPQLKYLPSQTAVTEFGIAVNRKFKTSGGEVREEVMFLDCSVFGKRAEVVNQYFKKGSQILVEGHLKFDTWDDKQGQKRSKHILIVDSFEFMGGAKKDGEAKESPIDTEQQFKDDDIPF